MEIKNESLRKMLASAAELRKREEEQKRDEEVEAVKSLPSVSEDMSKEVIPTISLSLEPSLPVTKKDLLENTKVADRSIKGDVETFNKAKRKVGRLTTGTAAAVPIVCKGETCPFKSKCPYYEAKIHEVGEDCLVEAQLIEYWTHKYMEELDIDTTSISEMHTLSNLVELAIMDLRMSNYIAINDQALMMDFIATVDPNGVPLTNKGASVAFDVKERIDRRRLKILETFNNTREKKIKLLIDSKDSEEKSTSRSILDKLDRISKSMQEKKSNIIDAEVVEIR